MKEFNFNFRVLLGKLDLKTVAITAGILAVPALVVRNIRRRNRTFR